MKHTAQSPLGVVVTDVDLADLSHGDVAEISILLARHGVAVFPGQQIDDAEFVAFLRRFGDIVLTPGETPVEGHPDLNTITNVGRTTTPKSSFHTDSSYLSRPPDYTALRAVAVPEQGGETVFTNQYRACETLPADLLEDLGGRTITHVVTGVEPGEGDETSAEHPVLRVHPLTGRTALYLSTPQRCAAVSGLDAEESAALVARLLEHSTAEDNTWRHAWLPGDVVMWDNGCVLHRADHTDVHGDRTMHRGMVARHRSRFASAGDPTTDLGAA